MVTDAFPQCICCNNSVVNNNCNCGTAHEAKIGIGGVGVGDIRIRCSASLSIAILITAYGVRSLGEIVSSWCAGTCSVVIGDADSHQCGVDMAYFCPYIKICCHRVLKVVESRLSV